MAKEAGHVPPLGQGWEAARTGMWPESARQGLAEGHLRQAAVGLGAAEGEEEAGKTGTLVAGPCCSPGW